MFTFAPRKDERRAEQRRALGGTLNKARVLIDTVWRDWRDQKRVNPSVRGEL